MSQIVQQLHMYFSFPFVVNAMIVGVLIALSSSLIGVPLVLKRFSYIGDGLSHVAFGAMALATIFKFSNIMIFTLPATALCAIMLLRIGQNKKINGDAAIAMMSVSCLALGYFLMNVFSVSMNISGDVCTTLFGSTSILTLTAFDVNLSLILSIVVVLVFIIFYNKIFSTTFDENFAKATGVNPSLYNLIFSVIIAAIIVLAMNLVGSLLVSALVIFPALSAMRLFKSFRSVTICSCIFSVFCSAIGILVSILWGTPVGATIVLIDLGVFLVSYFVDSVIMRRIA